MSKNNEYKKLKKIFFEAKVAFRRGRRALEEDPDNATLKKNFKKVRKVFRKVKAEKLAFKEEEVNKKEEEEVNKKRKRVEDSENYNPETFKTDEPCDTVCATNLPEEITANEVREHFGDCGGVKKLHFPQHEETNKFLGHAFIKFYGQIGAERAVNMSGEKEYKVFFADRGENVNWVKWSQQNKAKNPCFAYQSGRCTQGDSCRYSHSEKVSDCFAYKNGACTRGDSCRFSHGDSVGGVGSRVQKQNPCFAYQDGTCTEGDSCRFSHSGKVVECFSFRKGRCGRGDHCRFRHGVPSSLVGKCSDFKKGDCQRGASCRYSHGKESGGGYMPKECAGFKKGICRRATSCLYSHSGGSRRPIGVIECFDLKKKGNCDRGVSCPHTHGGIGRFK